MGPPQAGGHLLKPAPPGLVLLDLDDTLVDLAGAFAAWAGEFAAEHDLADDAVPWLRARASGRKDALFAEARDRFGLAEPAHVLWARYRARVPELVVPRPGVPDALAALRASGWRVGVVTNGEPDNQGAKLRRTGLAAHLDGWCASGEAGVRKPDPAIFHLAARRCGGGSGWVVGDSPELDVAGGRAAGFRTWWVSHGRPWPPGAVPPDRTSPDTADALTGLLHLDRR
ncbi:HAD family hydrolase [Saccharothrix sp. Mg75]|uniref:HAD family hydrolase n=1 Tax=Saccharothrix sp. Mg75 TaxID=3445357 RepID=UPI003EED26DD